MSPAGPLTVHHPLRAGPRLAVALLALAACKAAPEPQPERTTPLPERGMVVAEHPLAAGIGASVLQRGGNAADAAVATALALAVVFPEAGNLGGGGFALWVAPGGEAHLLDFREVAPAAADPALYLDANGLALSGRAREGALSVGVPGSPSGLWELHQRLGSGRFTFAALARPAIQLARDGFRVDARLARTLADEEVRTRLSKHGAARALCYPGGDPLEEGDQLVQGGLADTLQRYADRGPDEFVTGASAAALVAELDAQPRPEAVERWITPRDLAQYRPLWRRPLRGWFRGYEVVTAPPPSSGGLILLQTLAVLDGFPLDAERREALAAERLGTSSVRCDPCGLGERALHWWIETLRRSFAERARHLGDPDFADVPLEALLGPEWVARTRVEIGEAADEDHAPAPLAEGANTTHLSVVDLAGNAVSLTTTLNSAFGSGILVRGAGFFVNNQLDDFALPHSAPNQFGLVGGEANRIAPGKRPLSSMTPTVLLEGGERVALVLGSPGGPRIITAVIAVCLRVLVYGEELELAVAAPRFHQQWSPQATEFEPGWPRSLLDALRRRGHDAREVDRRFGGVQAIGVLPSGAVTGVSDPRRLGGAVGTDELRP